MQWNLKDIDPKDMVDPMSHMIDPMNHMVVSMSQMVDPISSAS